MIYEIIDLTNWKKKKDVLLELQFKGCPMDDRTLRRRIEENNKLFEEHIASKFIAHSKEGYIATTDRDIIMQSLKDNRKRAITMLKSNNKILKALGEDINMSLEV